MSQKRVTIVDPSGSKKTRVELPGHVDVTRLLSGLIPRMNLPPLDQAGEPVNYRLAYTRNGEEIALNPDQSLDDAGIEEDDTLRLYADMQGGSSTLVEHG